MAGKSTVAFALATAITVSAQGLQNMESQAKQYLSQATPISGTYQITAKSNNNNLIYAHFNQPEILASAKSADSLVQELASDISHAFASGDWLLTPNPSGDGSSSICSPQGNKCISAQWDFGTAPGSSGKGGFDHFAVAYDCAVQMGSSKCDNQNGLEVDKQYWVFLPVSGGSSASGNKNFASVKDTVSNSTSSSSSSDSSDDDGCEKPGDWLYRHGDADFLKAHPECKGKAVAPTCQHDKTWLAAHKEYIDTHDECKDVLYGKREVMEKKIKRDSDASGDYHILALDHLTNMATMAISGNGIKAFAGAGAAEMILYDPSGEDIVFTLTKSS